MAELRATLDLVASGAIYETEKFRDVPPHLRRLNDIAFSGDGEPTTYKNFDELMQPCADVKRAAGLDDVKMVLITNASMFHRPHVQRGLAILDATTAKSGPSSKRAPTSTTTSSSARRFRSGRFWTTSRPRPACGRW